MDGSNFVLHLYLMARVPFLWAGAHLANECLLRRPGWQEREGLAGLRTWSSRGVRTLAACSGTARCFHASHPAAFFVYKNHSSAAEAQAPTPSH